MAHGATMPSITCKCIECGFLAVHDEEGRGAFEAGKETRTSARMLRRNGVAIPADWFCSQKSDAFPDLVQLTRRDGTPGKSSDPIILAELNQDRECDSCRAYIPGKSPKEHEDMGIIERVEAMALAARAEANETAERRHQEQLAWQREAEARIERRFAEAEASTESRFVKSEAGTESRHGRTIGFTFLYVLLPAAITAGGIVALQYFLHLIFGAK